MTRPSAMAGRLVAAATVALISGACANTSATTERELRALRAQLTQLQREVKTCRADVETLARARDDTAAAPTQRGTDTGQSDAPLSSFVQNVGGRRYRIQRRGMEALLSNPLQLARAARVVPAMRGGKIVGFKLYGIRPGSFFRAIGWKNGDTVELINGHPLTSPDAAMEAYANIGAASRVSVTLSRDSAPLVFDYVIVDR